MSREFHICGPETRGPMRKVVSFRMEGSERYDTLECGHEVHCSYSDFLEYQGGPRPCPKCAAEQAASLKKDDGASPDRIAAMREAIESAASAIAFSPRDWSQHHRDAWIYGIIVGWDHPGDDEAMNEVAQRHGWTEATVERLRRLRQAICGVAENPVGPTECAKTILLYRTEIDRMEAAVRDLAIANVPGFHFTTHRVSMLWPCETSPLGMCVFRVNERGRVDDCMYCGKPVERK